jgi:hypothetical protein
MHRPPIINIFILFLLVVTAERCTKHADGIPGATGAAGQAGSNGSAVKSSPITGFIALVDPFGSPYLYSPGVSISLQTGNTTLTATTDSTGKFSLPALSPGNYSLHVTKPGYDSLDIYVQHSGGDEAKFIGSTKLYQTLSTKITSLTISFYTDIYSGGAGINLNTTLAVPSNTPTTERDFYFYFSHFANPTSKSYDVQSGMGTTATGNQLTLPYLLANITDNSKYTFHSGDTVYLKMVEIHPFTSLTSYYDYTADRYISYPYPGDSTTTWFRMP